MPGVPSIMLGQEYTDRDLIESVLSSFYIVDYGFINKVNGDNSVNVTHAKRLKSLTGESYPPTETKNLEVLTISTAGFSLSLDYKAGDKVLLLGLKNYVQNANDVTQATETSSYVHYSRETMKVLPLCLFNAEAKIKMEADAGTLRVTTEKKLEINGNDKQFVTWSELNQALQTFVTSLNSHTHSNGNGGSPTGTPIAPMTLDISSSKTTTVVTGG